MSQANLVLPALRGSFGDWIYYACLMPITDVGARVRYAEEIHPDKALSQLIQRSLEGSRARHIADYLASTKERFFNSLVLATYGGSPQWFEVGNFQTATDSEILKEISDSALDSLGFLRLSGQAKIFAIDGQHRLAGIKKALSSAVDLGQQLVPVIFVGHTKSAAGLQRTRRLFTILNKTAVPVQKRDIIALDEDDVMAIVCRRLVETNPAFRDPKIAVISSQNIPVSNQVCFTTISSLYDVLKLLFRFEIGQHSDRRLRFNRPSDERLNHFYDAATSYFAAVAHAFKPVRELFASTNPGEITEKHRGSHGGNLLFRPIGLDIFTRTAIEIARLRNVSLPEAVVSLRGLPMDLAKKPYQGVIWDTTRHKVIVGGKVVARDLVRYMAGIQIDSDQLIKDYRSALGSPNDASITLPAKVTESSAR